MIELYWACLIGGILFSLLTFLLGDLFDHGAGDVGGGMDHGLHLGDVFHPVILVSAVTAFGASGLIIDRIAEYDAFSEIALALLAALVVSVGLYFLYVKPMRNRENSVGYSMSELPGRIGTVSTTIPGKGVGEVLLTIAGTNTCQIASSAAGEGIREGERVVVVEVRDDVLMVVPLDEPQRIDGPTSQS